ncbi:hypothetical protein ND747_27965, partial [Frankia sp. R82]|nr:hypothetical protein [Frankia sp. R82]
PARPGGFGPAGGGPTGGGPVSGTLNPAGDGTSLGVSSAVGRHLLAHQGELAEIVTDDVAAAIRTVLNTHGEEIARMRRDDLGRDVHDALHALLTAYDRHLEQRGPLASPPFDADPRRRSELARRVWQGSPDLDRLRRATAGHPDLLQLTNEEDLRLLDPTPDTATFVRFIPRIAGPGRDEAAGSPDIAGLIRLTELTPGSARRASPPPTPRQRPASTPTPPPAQSTPSPEHDGLPPAGEAPPAPPTPTPTRRPAETAADEVWSGETTVGAPGASPAAAASTSSAPVENVPAGAVPAEDIPAEPGPSTTVPAEDAAARAVPEAVETLVASPPVRPAPLTAARPGAAGPVPSDVRTAPRPDLPAATPTAVPDPAPARPEHTPTEDDDLW